jgi:hypothetical protein
MFEVLLSGGAPATKTVYPNSGPGPQTLLLGDENIGYFGELSAGEVITNADLKAFLNPSMQSSVMVDKGWFKCFHKGKVKFISKGGTFTNTAWTALYASGGVYGTNDNGLYPIGTATNQYKPFNITNGPVTWKLIPKLMSGGQNDPSSSSPGDDGSEYTDLMYRMFTGTHPNGGAFLKYLKADVAMNSAHACVESKDTLTTSTIVRGYTGVISNSAQVLTKGDRSGYGQICRMVLVVEGDPKVLPV